MRHQLRFLPKAEKELNKIDIKLREKILIALDRIAQNPYSGKKLAGEYKNHYVCRAWPYRIIYLVTKNLLLVLVVRISHRQGVY